MIRSIAIKKKWRNRFLDVLWQFSGLKEIQTDPSFNALTHVLDTCKNEEDPIKNEGGEARWPSGMASDSEARGRGFDPHSGRRGVFLSKKHLPPKKYW